MKKIAYILLCGITICVSAVNNTIKSKKFSYHASLADSSPSELAQKVIVALRKSDLTEFKQLFLNAMKHFRHDKAAFSEFLDTRDEYGWTLLMHAAFHVDLEAIRFLLDAIKKYYGNDIQSIFNYIDARDKKGRSVLTLSSYIGNDYGFGLLLDAAANLFGADKQLFYQFISAADFDDQWTPLHYLTFDSSSVNIHRLIKKAAQILDVESPEFQSFINAKNSDGHSPIAYALSPEDKYFLLGYGAEASDIQTPGTPETAELGAKLIQTVKEESRAAVKQVLDEAQERFHDQGEQRYIDFITTRNGEGWSALMNAVADGHYDYVEEILNALEENVSNKELIFEAINNVDFHGRSVLLLALTRRHFKLAKFLLSEARKYAEDKNLFFMFVTIIDELNGYTPLLKVAANSYDRDPEAYDMISFMINFMKDIFGSDSRILYLFLNAEDRNGWTALDYVTDPKLYKLLSSYHIHSGVGKQVASTTDED